MGYVVGDDGLSVQDAETLDASTLTPLSPEVISRQATINIGASPRSLASPRTIDRSRAKRVLGLKSRSSITVRRSIRRATRASSLPPPRQAPR